MPRWTVDHEPRNVPYQPKPSTDSFFEDTHSANHPRTIRKPFLLIFTASEDLRPPRKTASSTLRFALNAFSSTHRLARATAAPHTDFNACLCTSRVVVACFASNRNAVCEVFLRGPTLPFCVRTKNAKERERERERGGARAWASPARQGARACVRGMCQAGCQGICQDMCHVTCQSMCQGT